MSLTRLGSVITCLLFLLSTQPSIASYRSNFSPVMEHTQSMKNIAVSKTPESPRYMERQPADVLAIRKTNGTASVQVESPIRGGLGNPTVQFTFASPSQKAKQLLTSTQAKVSRRFNNVRGALSGALNTTSAVLGAKKEKRASKKRPKAHKNDSTYVEAVNPAGRNTSPNPMYNRCDDKDQEAKKSTASNYDVYETMQSSLSGSHTSSGLSSSFNSHLSSVACSPFLTETTSVSNGYLSDSFDSRSMTSTSSGNHLQLSPPLIRGRSRSSLSQQHSFPLTSRPSMTSFRSCRSQSMSGSFRGVESLPCTGGGEAVSGIYESPPPPPPPPPLRLQKNFGNDQVSILMWFCVTCSLRQDPPLIWVFGHFWLFCTMV